MNAECKVQNVKLWYAQGAFFIPREAHTFILHYEFCILH